MRLPEFRQWFQRLLFGACYAHEYKQAEIHATTHLRLGAAAATLQAIPESMKPGRSLEEHVTASRARAQLIIIYLRVDPTQI